MVSPNSKFITRVCPPYKILFQEIPMTARPSFRQALNRAVAERRLLVVPGGYDALSALLIERAEFDSMFVGGFPVAGARYGVPDIGLKGFTDIAAAVRDIIAACDVPVLVDIDDGYGDVKNAVHTVQSYERMGASAVFLEDQAWPKRCGHMAGKKVVPAEIMEAKVRATMAERLYPETLICVRTDARAVLGLDEALRRAERYIKAGAEAIFVEAPESVAELERVAKSFDVPQFANPLVGGKTPILTPKEFEELGFSAICFGLETIMHAAKAIQTVLADMRAGTFALRDKGMSFEEFKSVVHYDRWDRIDNAYGV
jgi:2-methylisocitrate lyase-like PEP mutase family enzyme